MATTSSILAMTKLLFINKTPLKCILVALLFLFGCAPTLDIDNVEVRRSASNMQIFKVDDEIPDNYNIIGVVKGIACGGQKNTSLGQFNNPPASIDEAYRKLKINAAKINANGIINVFCEDTGIDWSKNCWTTITCVGDAITFN